MRTETFTAIDYAGDDQPVVVGWFRERLRSIGTCLQAGHPEAALVLVYSGIDTFGWLGSGQAKATRDSFIRWCDRYLLPELQKDGLRSPSSKEFYAARCGLLHTSTSPSNLSCHDGAREIFYVYGGKCGVNLGLNSTNPPWTIHAEDLAAGFKGAGSVFLKYVQSSTDRSAFETKSRSLFRWGSVVTNS